MLDPVSSAIILNLFSSTLYSLVGQVGKSGEKNAEQRKRETQALQPTLQSALDRVSEEVDLQGVDNQGPICLFLSSPEAEAIIRQVYSAELLDGDNQNTVDAIRSEFLASLSRVLVSRDGELRELSHKLFDALIKGCHEVLVVAIDQGILPAHEAMSNFRFHILHDEIAALHRKIDLFSLKSQPDYKAILAFEETYRNQVRSRHWFIIPPNFDVARKVPINDIYVQSRFTRAALKNVNDRNRATHSPQEIISVDRLLPNAYRLVILGNPGGGKSTFSTKLCYDLASRYNERLFGSRQLTPIFIVLREYGARKKEHDYSLLDFIIAAANSDYQVVPPPHAFEYLLTSGRVMVILDGLDELLDTRDRQIISNDVESFCNLYPTVPVIVTSREVGYEQAPLNENIFQVYRLAAFDEAQIKEYVEKWFVLDTELGSQQVQQKITSFLTESRAVPDLRSNPLMLSLLCNIYRGENYLPRNRPDVYEKCATMLFERWDRSRNIAVTLPFEVSIRPAMMFLAHWIYSEEELQSGVTEDRLIQQASDYLSDKRYEDKDEANAAAREFIEFCRGRAWVFTDTGTTKNGERLYQFTHRTFLEFFTSFYLIRKYPSAPALLKTLQPKIMKAEWDVVAQLAFQLLNKYQEGVGDLLLDGLLKRRQRASAVSSANLLSFATRSLSFLVPGPKTVRDIVSAVFAYSLSNPADLIVPLLFVAYENRPVVARGLRQLIEDQMEGGTDDNKILSLKIARQLPFAYTAIGGSDYEPRYYFGKLSEEIINSHTMQFRELAVKDKHLCFFAFAIGLVSPRAFVEWHGLDSLFLTQPTLVNRELSLHSPVAIILALAIQPRASWQDWELAIFKNFAENYEPLLEDIGRILLESPRPWYTRDRKDDGGPIGYGSLSWQFVNLDDKQAECHLSSHAMFGALLIVATFVEYIGDQQSSTPAHINITQTMGESNNPMFKLLLPLLICRYTDLNESVISDHLNSLAFDAEEAAFVRRWLTREVNLVASGNTSPQLMFRNL